MPLMEFYLYPPKYLSSTAIATLTPPANRQSDQAEPYRASKPELAGAKLAVNYVNAVKHALDAKPALVAPASTT
jgi:hypothetical protein